MSEPQFKVDALIQVFAKVPVPGQVKTRLARHLGEVFAARVASQLIDTLLLKLTADTRCPVEVWCSPDSDHGFWQDLRRRYGVCLQEQSHGDLGQRMQYALLQGLRRAKKVILIGTDCPALDSIVIEQALQALNNGKQAVLQPAEDGGYVLIGVSGPLPECVFSDMPWGTRRVLDFTLHCLKRKSICFDLLDTVRDLDTYQDYLYYVRAGALPYY